MRNSVVVACMLMYSPVMSVHASSVLLVFGWTAQRFVTCVCAPQDCGRSQADQGRRHGEHACHLLSCREAEERADRRSLTPTRVAASAARDGRSGPSRPHTS
eukprot:3490779-Pleurochrysis_carterae.AAC.2